MRGVLGGKIDWNGIGGCIFNRGAGWIATGRGTRYLWCRPSGHLGCGSVSPGRMRASNGHAFAVSRLGSGKLPDPVRGWLGEGLWDLWASAPAGFEGVVVVCTTRDVGGEFTQRPFFN